MRVLFFGSGSFGIPALTALLESSHELVGIVLNPDRPSGRGRKVVPSRIKMWAAEHNIHVLEIDNVNAPVSLERLQTVQADLFLIVSFGTILSRELLTIPPMGCVNIHPSLLPKYRGASPIAQALVNGDAETGSTIMRIKPEVDAGDMLVQGRMPLTGDENASEVWNALAQMSAEMLIYALDGIESGDLIPVQQDESQVVKCSKFTKQDALIDWHWPAETIHNRVRGLHMWPGTHTFLDGKLLKVLRTRRTPEVEVPFNVEPGMVLRIEDPHGICVAAGDKKGLWVVELQPEGKKPMHYKDFLNGNPLRLGTHLGE